MITDITTRRLKSSRVFDTFSIHITPREREERDALADLLGQITDWRTELLDTVPFNGRRIQLLDRIIKNLQTRI